jgi:hypothetical protein
MSSFTGPSTPPPSTPPTVPSQTFMTVDADTQLEVIMALLTINDTFAAQLLQRADHQVSLIQYIDVNGTKRQIYTDKNGAKFFHSGIKSPRKKYLTSYLDEKKVERPPTASNKALDQFKALTNPNTVSQNLEQVFIDDDPSEVFSNLLISFL